MQGDLASQSQTHLAGDSFNSAAPDKTLTACLQATKNAAPAAVELSGLQRSARVAAAKSRKSAVEAVAERESVGPVAAKTPTSLADPKVGCGSVTQAMELEVSQGKLAWHAC